ncbi:alpha/beta-hydrolase [Mycena maculata]|uniref:carboxypeptidase C n=1 Tax=Mycena maculata TaxID=230809 RepID=A0AAD7MN56_9AGAR|nr:alpha/beta-hydrolase [Mycena maculata]
MGRLSSPNFSAKHHSTQRSLRNNVVVTLAAIVATAVCATFWFRYIGLSEAPSAIHFYARVTRPRGICLGVRGDAPSYAGYIGLQGDTPDSHRRSFFWLFEAEENASDAPLILTVGGGPGTTGLLKPLGGQGPCILTPNGTVPNPDRITQRFNLLALDHPIGTGFSYGRMVNNSHDAALDVHDFLQKFYLLFPRLAKNQLIISGGSYGGKYLPNIATVIQEKNEAIVLQQSKRAIHIDLESLMISNPSSDPIAHYRWLLFFRCELHSLYDAATCAAMYAKLPECLDLISISLQDTGFSQSANKARRTAREFCYYIAWGGDTHGVIVEDIRRTCNETDTLRCFPHFEWIERYLRDSATMRSLGVPPFFNFTALSDTVEQAFFATGDVMLPAHLLYEPLLSKGIRVLHYIGAQDGNCAWPGILSFLKALRTPFQREFMRASDVPWPTSDYVATTVRAVGEGAGNMTYILIDGAGHFPSQDQPELVKKITERWISNSPWV